MTRRYFLSLVRKDASILGCRVQVLVDGREIAQVTGLEQLPFREVSAHLTKGAHKVTLRVRRPPGAGADPDDVDPKKLRDAFLEVQLGHGRVDGPQALLDEVHAGFRCTDRTPGLVEKSFNFLAE